MSLERCHQEVNSIVGSANICTHEVEYSSYGYNVHEWIAGAFCAAYGVALGTSYILEASHFALR